MERGLCCFPIKNLYLLKKLKFANTLAVILNQHLIKRRKQEEYKTAHSSPPDYETKNVVSSSDWVSCAEKDERRKVNGDKRTECNDIYKGKTVS